MIKKVFWMLVLVNAALLAFLQWGGALTQGGGGLQPALNPEKIKLLGLSALPAASAVVAPASTPQVPLTPPAKAVPPVPAGNSVSSAPLAQAPVACLQWGDFSGADLTRAQKDLAGLKLGDSLTQREVEHAIGYWVYIPPQQNRDALNAKVARLKKRGVKEFFVVQEKGKWYGAISLNVFKTRDLAKRFQDRLKAKGIRDAVIGERQTRLKFTVFTLRSPDADTLSKLVEWQQGFTGIEMKSVACK